MSTKLFYDQDKHEACHAMTHDDAQMHIDLRSYTTCTVLVIRLKTEKFDDGVRYYRPMNEDRTLTLRVDYAIASSAFADFIISACKLMQIDSPTESALIESSHYETQEDEKEHNKN